MKKQILAIAAIMTAACGLAACHKKDDTSKFDALNAMLDISYSKIEITVTDTFDDDLFLESKYTIQYSESAITVSYTVEKFAELSLANPLGDMKTTLTGEAVIQSGVIVSVEGDKISLSADIAKPGLSFKEEYFENAELTNILFKADVKDASGFMGTEITCTDMKAEATFLDALYNINITYTSASGNAVEYLYVFTV